MFAVVRTGGKQYKVARGDVLSVEKLAAEPGEKVQFNDILMVGGDKPAVGAPEVDGAAVQGEVLDQTRGEKKLNFVKRRRKHGSKRTKGHRQYLTVVRVTDILESGAGESGVKAAEGASGAPRAEAAKTTPKRSAKKAAPKGGQAAKARQEQKPQSEPEEAAAAKPANLLDGPREGQKEDLAVISGLGPKLQERLNEHGVFHTDQIAAWDAGNVAYMDEKLGLNGRIGREDWIGQATALASDKE